MKIVYLIDIKTKSEVVFSWIGDPDEAMAWQTSASESEIIHEKRDRSDEEGFHKFKALCELIKSGS